MRHRGFTVEADTYQITVEPGITITAARTTSRDIRRHKAFQLPAAGYLTSTAHHAVVSPRLLSCRVVRVRPRSAYSARP